MVNVLNKTVLLIQAHSLVRQEYRPSDTTKAECRSSQEADCRFGHRSPVTVHFYALSNFGPFGTHEAALLLRSISHLQLPEQALCVIASQCFAAEACLLVARRMELNFSV